MNALPLMLCYRQLASISTSRRGDAWSNNAARSVRARRVARAAGPRGWWGTIMRVAMQKCLRYFLGLVGCLLLISSLTACAFKLRSQDELPVALRVIYLEAEVPADPLALALKRSLHAAGVTLLDQPIQAPIRLLLSKPVEMISNTTVGASNQARIYVVSLTVTFELRDSKDKVLLSPRSLTATRTISLSANQLLTTNNQLSLLEQELRRDLINQMFDRLSSQQVLQATSGSHS